ncbi:MAG: Prepilin-type N-terminal cleavage/methylation domain-containing protein [Nitrospira sp.]|nr:MAG: Prepilin-type N-terminal cleavage/methylation domain-containing protein [Nitrospira sp.]
MNRYRANSASFLGSEKGFSLTEALTSIAIVGLVSALAIPNLMALNARMQADVFAQQVSSELRWARQWAISKRDRVRLVFDQERQAIVVQVGNDRAQHHQLSYQHKGLEIDEPSAGPDVVFHPSGRSATATTIQFHNGQGHARTITVSLTGRVSLR